MAKPIVHYCRLCRMEVEQDSENKVLIWLQCGHYIHKAQPPPPRLALKEALEKAHLFTPRV